MPDILPILLKLAPALPKTVCRQLHRIVFAMFAMTGRITQLGISRWTDKGGSYRTIHRFFHTQIDWLRVQWLFFEHFLFRPDTVYLLAGDESIVSKSGKHTYGVGWFFSSILNTVIPGLAFFSIAIIDVTKRRAYPLAVQQVIRSEEEKEQTRKRKAKQKTTFPQRPRGRPKGSKNKNKADLTLSPELQRILAQGQAVMNLIREKLAVAYFVLDGHFGNAFATAMVRQMGLHILSKMPHNAELYLLPTAAEKAEHPRLKYGARIDYKHLPEETQVSSTTEAGYCTEVYQATCLHKHFADFINVVIIVRTHLASGRVGHVVLFSSDLRLEAVTLIDYYALRFQIEFTFRDAKQYFGLEDFMGVKEIAIHNAVGLSFFMVNLSRHLLDALRPSYPGAGVNDLKSFYRARYYIAEVLKCVPENAGDISYSALVEQVCRPALIHPKQNSQTELELAA
ncbi:MAG: transposase [Chloroflexota bacterium]|nr:transposase [Chloroflexota bacterium]